MVGGGQGKRKLSEKLIMSVSFRCLTCVIDVVAAEVMLAVVTERDSDVSLLTSSVPFLTAAALTGKHGAPKSQH